MTAKPLIKDIKNRKTMRTFCKKKKNRIPAFLFNPWFSFSIYLSIIYLIHLFIYNVHLSIYLYIVYISIYLYIIYLSINLMIYPSNLSHPYLFYISFYFHCRSYGRFILVVYCILFPFHTTQDSMRFFLANLLCVFFVFFF